MNEYERKRQENIEANQKILREMGLEKPQPLPSPKPPTQKKRHPKNPKRKRIEKNRITTRSTSLRRSSRLANKVHTSIIHECINIKFITI